MRFSVGYQLRDDDLLISAIEKYAENIAEIYFSWEDLPNGRNTLDSLGINRYVARQKQEYDLSQLAKHDFSFNLLLNGNCYGKYSQSRSFFAKIGDTVEYLQETYDLKSVTTTSPLIAKFLKQNFEDIEVRASVNMGIDGTTAMDYVAEYFDSFYLKREYNRNLKRIKEARAWCDNLGKKLYGLANSGCLNYCSLHTFHDNLVSHESEISAMDNAYEYEAQCSRYLKSEKNQKKWLSISNFIRPEDVPLYEDYFDGLKLATRVNKNPMRVISAYCKGSYSGAITDLLEPNHSGLFYPNIVENKKIDSNFSKTVLNCKKDCGNCNYCTNVLNDALIVLE
ncbi:MAG: hypothetical protein IJO62_05325 [Clostridia bacterium]|nr:hypothetical protein [Clostridia bacterium]